MDARMDDRTCSPALLDESYVRCFFADFRQPCDFLMAFAASFFHQLRMEQCARWRNVCSPSSNTAEVTPVATGSTNDGCALSKAARFAGSHLTEISFQASETMNLRVAVVHVTCVQ